LRPDDVKLFQPGSSAGAVVEGPSVSTTRPNTSDGIENATTAANVPLNMRRNVDLLRNATSIVQPRVVRRSRGDPPCPSSTRFLSRVLPVAEQLWHDWPKETAVSRGRAGPACVRVPFYTCLSRPAREYCVTSAPAARQSAKPSLPNQPRAPQQTRNCPKFARVSAAIRHPPLASAVANGDFQRGIDGRSCQPPSVAKSKHLAGHSS
jgi:hypothetical protein